MAAQQLGRGRCPLCNDNGARVSLSKNGYAVLTCAAKGCGLQLFTRSEGADEMVRDLIVATPADPRPAPAPTPEAVNKAMQRADLGQPIAGAITAPPPAPAPKAPAAAPTWGALSW